MLDASTMWIRYSSVEDGRETPTGQSSSPFRRFTFLAMYTVEASLQEYNKPKIRVSHRFSCRLRAGERPTPSTTLARPARGHERQGLLAYALDSRMKVPTVASPAWCFQVRVLPDVVFQMSPASGLVK